MEFNEPSWYSNFASGFSHAPFGSIANANFAGNAGMINPFANNQTNQQNLILEPASFHPQFLNLAPFISQVQSSVEDNNSQKIVGSLPPPTAQEMNPDNYTGIENFLSGQLSWFNDISKKMFIITLAAILLIMGLYFLAKSTDVGQIAIGAAKEAAMT